MGGDRRPHQTNITDTQVRPRAPCRPDRLGAFTGGAELPSSTRMVSVVPEHEFGQRPWSATSLPDTYSAISAAPVGPMPQRAKPSEMSLLRCRSTRTMLRAASSVRSLKPRSKEVSAC